MNMTVINTNTGALYAQSAMNTNARGLSTVMQQLSTGKRINNAVDDTAGLAISTRLTSQIKGLNQAVRNANDGISLIQTAEGSTEQITNMLQRMRELAVQSSNDTNNANDRGFLNGEFTQLRSEINRIASNTQWNGANILDGTAGNKSDGNFAFQVGANANQTINAQLSNLQTYDGVSFAASQTTTVQTMALSGLDASGAANLGRAVQLTVGSNNYTYRVSQTDIDAVTGANGTALKSLSETVADALVTAAGASQTEGSNTFTLAKATGGTGTTTLTLTTTGTITLNATAITGASITSSVGALNAINANDITTGTNSYAALGAIDSAMQTVNQKRSDMGAVISRLQFASDNLTNISAKATESRSRIEDTDYSVATTELAKRNIIQQAAQAMLAQANQAPQMVLQLLK